MDVFIVGILTFFALVIGGLFYWSHTSAASRSGRSPLQLDVSPEAVVEMQLEEILESHQAASETGNSFRFAFAEKDAYDALVSSSPDGGKPLQSALLKRCIECLNGTMAFDARVKVVYESYNNLVPKEVLHFLGGAKTQLTDEIEAIKAEANRLREGWGATIFNQAMDLTVGLQRRKEARVQAEQSKATDAKSKVNQKANSARLEEETKQRQQRDADRAYRELLGEAPKKAADATSASNKKTVNKTTSQKK